jgi:hypothetical protein
MTGLFHLHKYIDKWVTVMLVCVVILCSRLAKAAASQPTSELADLLSSLLSATSALFSLFPHPDSAATLFVSSASALFRKTRAVAPFSAPSQTRKGRSLSPVFATLTNSASRKSFACHSYKNHRGGTPPPHVIPSAARHSSSLLHFMPSANSATISSPTALWAITNWWW